MKFIRILFATFFFTGLVSTSALAAGETDLEEAKVYVEELSQEALKILSDQEKSRAAMAEDVFTLLEKHMAVTRIGRIVLGRAAWGKMDENQQKEYTELFEDYLLIKYSNLVGSYEGQKFDITKSIRSGKKDAMVFTRIYADETGNAENSVTVGWRVKTIKDSFKLLDVKIADISMVQTERDQFQSVYKNSGVDGLMETLRGLVIKMQEKREQLAETPN